MKEIESLNALFPRLRSEVLLQNPEISPKIVLCCWSPVLPGHWILTEPSCNASTNFHARLVSVVAPLIECEVTAVKIRRLWISILSKANEHQFIQCIAMYHSQQFASPPNPPAMCLWVMSLSSLALTLFIVLHLFFPSTLSSLFFFSRLLTQPGQRLSLKPSEEKLL